MLRPIIEAADERSTAAEQLVEMFKEQAGDAGPVRDFGGALVGNGLGLIAEIKRRSPSAGAIAEDLDPVTQAVAYEAGGADAISVLTEPHFFGGSLDDLRRVRSAVSVPVLRKDFTRTGAQIWEARAAGADAVLLIVATLADDDLSHLVEVADEVGVDAIVEAHTIREVEIALTAGAGIVGVNNRDLVTFTTDLAVAEDAAGSIPPDIVSIGESGVSNIEAASRMARAGYDAILVGEALVRHPDPARFVAELKAAR